MNTYTINFYLQEESHGCGCEGHDHEREHEHEHEHEVRDDYEVVGTIKTFGAWANIMPDSYLVKSELKAEEMKEKIMEHLKPNDILLITKVDGKDSASSIDQAIEWINR
ncbi:hypothetical protein [uncultured Clostridium sp.]|uniref:hypothetical protein n=1 Tax=uncultured Clostridium sp. TaxID=59620 RepID=UPI0026369D3E|nr:hypothetical protein [uncultured Clostridium sp.]